MVDTSDCNIMNLAKLRKEQLIALCEEKGLQTDGLLKDEILALLKNHMKNTGNKEVASSGDDDQGQENDQQDGRDDGEESEEGGEESSEASFKLKMVKAESDKVKAETAKAKADAENPGRMQINPGQMQSG